MNTAHGHVCRCGHVSEDHIPDDIHPAQPCGLPLCPCMRFEP